MGCAFEGCQNEADREYSKKLLGGDLCSCSEHIEEITARNIARHAAGRAEFAGVKPEDVTVHHILFVK